MFLPKPVYESLPAIYIAIGTLLIAGAAYIGVRNGLMLGYLAVGLSCVLAGIFITSKRQKARSETNGSEA